MKPAVRSVTFCQSTFTFIKASWVFSLGCVCCESTAQRQVCPLLPHFICLSWALGTTSTPLLIINNHHYYQMTETSFNSFSWRLLLVCLIPVFTDLITKLKDIWLSFFAMKTKENSFQMILTIFCEFFFRGVITVSRLNTVLAFATSSLIIPDKCPLTWNLPVRRWNICAALILWVYSQWTVGLRPTSDEFCVTAPSGLSLQHDTTHHHLVGYICREGQ